MLSILVCHSYFLELDHKQRERGKPYPPLATLQVAEMLRRAGHEVSLFDAMLAEGVDEFRGCLQAAQPQLVLFYEDNFNFLSKMCLGTMREAACEMIALSRLEGARVIAAGPDVSDFPGPYLTAGADVTLSGEGLLALLNIVARLERQLQAAPADLVAGVGATSISWMERCRSPRARRTCPIPNSRASPPGTWSTWIATAGSGRPSTASSA